MIPGFDPAEMRQRYNQTDRAVAAHAEIADVVEKDHPRHAGLVRRFHQQRPHQHIRAARFVYHRRAEGIVLFTENLQPFGHRALAQVRTAGNDNACRFAAGVGINDGDLFHLRFGSLGRVLMPS